MSLRVLGRKDCGTTLTLKWSEPQNETASQRNKYTPWGSTTTYTYEHANASGLAWSEYARNRLLSKTVSRSAGDIYAWPDETTTYQVNATGTQTTVTAPDQSQTVYKLQAAFPLDEAHEAHAGLVIEIDHPDGSITGQYWADNTPAQNGSGYFNNPYIKTEYNYLGGLTSVRDIDLDLNGNTTAVREYDLRILRDSDHPFSAEADHPFSRDSDQRSRVKPIAVFL